MRRVLQLIVLLKNFSTGVMAPVLSLALLAHGATIGTVSLMIGAYSLTVIAAEFPSGVFADVYGRKRAFLLAAAFYFLSYCLMLPFRSAAVLFCAMVLNGLGRAFSSGSLEALAIDEAGADDGAVVRITARFSILESVGLAAGALIGGLASGLSAGYAGNLGANAGVCALMFFLTLFRVHEPPRERAQAEETAGSRIGAQVRESLAFLAQRGTVRLLFALALATVFALISVETYWQPALSSFQPAPWVFGAVSFAGFFAVIAGTRLAERLLTKRADRGATLLLSLKALFGAGLILLAFQFREAGFLAVYMLAYFFLGGGGVAENTLLNRAIPSDKRASVLSLFSFVVQIGGLIASALGYLVSVRWDFRAMWWIAGALLALSAGAFAILNWKGRHQSTELRNGAPDRRRFMSGVYPDPEADPFPPARFRVKTRYHRRAKGGMRVYKLKTHETDTSAQAVVDRIAHPGRRKDAQALLDIYASATGFPPRVWGEKQIGFGRYRYKYASGHQGEFYMTGFSAAGAKISLYLYLAEDAREETLKRLGKATAGKSCVYIGKLEDIDIGVLKELIAGTVRFVSATYPGGIDEANP
jgi:MFS family permease